MTNQVGLVLEGGGMRGLYTAGVLEYFLEKQLFFPYVIGVSAGACMAASYLSRQKGRNKKVNIDLVKDPRYLSYRNLLMKKELFGMDFLFDEIPNRIVPFDYDTFFANEEQFVVGTTDCETGKPIYFTKNDYKDDMLTVIRASSSLPFVAPTVQYNNKTLLDGGLIDPIPIKKAEQDGMIKNVVIMTKPEQFIRKKSMVSSIAKWLYRKYPSIAKTMDERHMIYNDQINYIHYQQRNGQVYVIQPSANVRVSRIETNQQRLLNLYELGYYDAKNHFRNLKNWMNEC